jgi:RimJ/RimL family protein N-acetyltransferase
VDAVGARGPRSLDDRLDLLRSFRGRFDLGEDFVYGIFSSDESEVLGGSGLHVRVGSDALEIGYWIRASHVGRGIARETTAALTRAAFHVCGVDRVEIHVEGGARRGTRSYSRCSPTRSMRRPPRAPTSTRSTPSGA